MIVYTAIFGEFDTLRPLPPGLNGVCFSDGRQVANGWQVVPPKYDDTNPSKRAKHHRCMPHRLFPGEVTLWIDASYELKKLPPEVKLGAFPHFNTSLHGPRDEYNFTVLCRRFQDEADMASALAQVEKYEADGYKDKTHIECGFLVRDASPEVAAFNELWWKEIEHGTTRDQISFGWSRWKSGIDVTLLNGTSKANEYSILGKHLPPRPEIYYFTPYSSNGLAEAYNKCCALVPDNAWVCLMDADIMLFPPNFGTLIEDTIIANPQYDVYTCLTSRINPGVLGYLLPGGRTSEERDLVKLHDQAVGLSKSNYLKVREIPMNLAGYFMLFRKSLWKEVPCPTRSISFKHNGMFGGGKVVGVDSAWSHAFIQARKRVCCMDGIMAVHFYRLGQDNFEAIDFLESAYDCAKIRDVPEIQPQRLTRRSLSWQMRRKALTNQQ